MTGAVHRLVAATLGDHAAERLRSQVLEPDLGPAGAAGPGEPVERVVLAHALNLCLFADVVGRVPSAAAYVESTVAAGRPVVLDHGAVRTVAGRPRGELPRGHVQVARLLEPLGFELRHEYDLARLAMTGRSYAHRDLPEQIGQWFVSELHPDHFSPAFGRAVDDVLEPVADPISPWGHAALAELERAGRLEVGAAASLLAELVGCFRRLHRPPTESAYECLLDESPEMAWIATEGTTFNHVTDRVDDVHAVAVAEAAAGRPIKDTVEVSASGRVRQTAHRAPLVARPFLDRHGAPTTRRVPGSFFELISRDRLPSGELDLAFDAANATGIFQMTVADR